MFATDFSGIDLMTEFNVIKLHGEKNNFAVSDYMPYCIENVKTIFLKSPIVMK